MADINSLTVVGRLTRDAEVRAVGEKQVASFSVASGYYSKQNSDAVNFFDVEMWSPGGLLQYLKKGKQVAINGELRQERWTDKENQNRSRVKILVHQLQLVGGKDGAGNQGAAGQSEAAEQPYSDDIPF